MTALLRDAPGPVEGPASIPREIALLAKAATYLEQCQGLDEVKSLRDKAEAIRLYQRKIGESQRAQNAAAEIKIRAERRMGELIPGLGVKPGRPSNGSTVGPLRSLGIGKTESHRG